MPRPDITRGEAQAADLAALDELGSAPCRFAGRAVCLSVLRTAAEPDGFYHMGWHDDAGGYFSGVGKTPSEALAAAELAGPARRAA